MDMASGTRASKKARDTALIGTPAELPQADLPTNRDVLRRMLQIRENAKLGQPLIVTALKMADEVIEPWLPCNSEMERSILSRQQVQWKIQNLWRQIKSKPHKKKAAKGKCGKKATKTEATHLDTVFDICSCHCQIIPCLNHDCPPECDKRVHIDCTRPKSKKILLMELEFILDQRTKSGTKGKLQIGARDKKTSKMMQHKTERREKERKWGQKRKASEEEEKETRYAKYGKEQSEEDSAEEETKYVDEKNDNYELTLLLVGFLEDVNW